MFWYILMMRLYELYCGMTPTAMKELSCRCCWAVAPSNVSKYEEYELLHQFEEEDVFFMYESMYPESRTVKNRRHSRNRNTKRLGAMIVCLLGCLAGWRRRKDGKEERKSNETFFFNLLSSCKIFFSVSSSSPARSLARHTNPSQPASQT